MGYGENQEFNALQGAAPLAATPSVSNTRARRTSPAEQGVAATSLFSPTGFPEEPITAGADFGPGAGATPMPQSQMQGMGTLTNTVRRMAAADPSGDSLRLLAIVERLGW
jgi:hypothetical protein